MVSVGAAVVETTVDLGEGEEVEVQEWRMAVVEEMLESAQAQAEEEEAGVKAGSEGVGTAGVRVVGVGRGVGRGVGPGVAWAEVAEAEEPVEGLAAGILVESPTPRPAGLVVAALSRLRFGRAGEFDVEVECGFRLGLDMEMEMELELE